MARPTAPLLLAVAVTVASTAGAQGLTEPAPDARPLGAAPDAPSPANPSSPEPPGTTLPRGTVLEEVSGVVREVDRKGHRVSVNAAAGPVTLSMDRNTMVYTAAGLGTVLDVVPGAEIRAGRNSEFLAYWVQVRVPAGKTESPPSTPGQGTGPAGGAAAGATEAGSGPAPGTAGPGAGTPGPGPTPGR